MGFYLFSRGPKITLFSLAFDDKFVACLAVIDKLIRFHLTLTVRTVYICHILIAFDLVLIQFCNVYILVTYSEEEESMHTFIVMLI